MRRWLVVVVVVVAVLVPWCAPVARASSLTGCVVGPYASSNSTLAMFAANWTGVANRGSYIEMGSGSGYWGNVTGTGPVSLSIRGQSIPVSELNAYVVDGGIVNLMFRVDRSLFASGSGAVSISASTSTSWYGSASWSFGGLVDLSGVGEYASLSVELSGVSSVTVGTSYDYSAVASGGVGPYRVVFQRVCTSHSVDDRTYAAQSGSGPVFTESVVFPSAMWSYDVVVTVTDSLGAIASDSVTVNARAERPTVYGYLYESATSQGGGLLLFYASLTPPGDTWPGESGMLSVEGPGAGRYWYTLDVPGWSTHWANGYTLSLAEPFPATVTAMVTMHDQTTGDSWTLVFSFDTSGLTGPGSWTSSEGGGESFGEDENWIGRLLNSLKAMLKEVFQWLFVPTDDQMRSLVPSGTIANGLLEGVPSLGSGEKGEFTVSMKLPLSDGVEVPIMVIDTREFASTTFAVVVRTVVQAGMSLGLILMVVSWI